MYVSVGITTKCLWICVCANDDDDDDEDRCYKDSH